MGHKIGLSLNGTENGIIFLVTESGFRLVKKGTQPDFLWQPI